MIIRLTRMEHRVLTAMTKTPQDRWVNAREIASVVFADTPSANFPVTKNDVRTVRNSLRKIVREQMAQMHPSQRGCYTITERGKSAVKNTGRNIESLYSHGQAIRGGRKIAQSIYESRTGKPAEVKTAPDPAALPPTPVTKKNLKKSKSTKSVEKAEKKPEAVASAPEPKKHSAPKRPRSTKKSDPSQVVLEAQGSNGVSHQPIVSADGLGNAVL